MFLSEHFLNKFYNSIEKVTESGCWIWMGATEKDYGRFGTIYKDTGEQWAHRASYKHFIGEIPPGWDTDHKCRVTLCVNPDHLEAVTHAENMARGVMANISHCKNGHALSGDNIRFESNYVESGIIQSRRCKTCKREYDAARRERLMNVN